MSDVVTAHVNIRLDMSDGAVEELICDLDLRQMGAGFTARLLEDLHAEGLVVRASSRPAAPKQDGMVIAVRGALIRQPDDTLFTQKRHEGKDWRDEPHTHAGTDCSGGPDCPAR